MKPKCSDSKRFHPGEYLAEELESRGWGAAQLAERTGLSPEEIRAYIEEEKLWTIGEWDRVARALGQSIQVWLQLQMTWKRGKE